MTVARIAPLAVALQVAVLSASGDASAADPSNWDCAKETRGGAEVYTCRECSPPQSEAGGLQICQVYDFTVGVDAHESNETELVILVTPYLAHPAGGPLILRPPDRLELRKAEATEN
jgi:hypothetical protein